MELRNLVFPLAAGLLVFGLFAQTKIDEATQVRGGGTQAIVFVDSEIPTGTIDGINLIFTLAAAPIPPTSLHLYRNGLRQSALLDFTLSAATITFNPTAVPKAGDTLLADYRK